MDIKKLSDDELAALAESMGINLLGIQRPVLIELIENALEGKVKLSSD